MSRPYRALISVSKKDGVVEFAKGLVELGFQIVSTGRTATSLRDAGISAVDVSEYTHWPEMMGGRLKTLHPMVHGGILRRDGVDNAVVDKHGIWEFDVVVVNLYPFEEKIAEPTTTWDEAIENIDIGGPAMLRSAAKNHHLVTVVVDPNDYGEVLKELREMRNGQAPWSLRRFLAYKAFRHTSDYDNAIAGYINDQLD